MVSHRLKLNFPDGLPKNSGFLDGHFTDGPIVPGAILLGLAAEGLGKRGQKIEKLVRVKFLRQLKPAVPFEVTCDLEGSSATIVWTTETGRIAEARAHLERENG